jgi:prepilin-type N-terminal cleavage/methylation domain-containing protein
VRRRATTVAGERGFTLVELLIVMALTGIVMAGAYSVVMQSMRTEQYTDQLRSVMEDGRVSLDRIRAELREARLVYGIPTCAADAEECLSSHRLSFWVDRNQDHIAHPDEQVHYCVREVGATECVQPAQGGRYELVRWTGDPLTAGESPTGAQVIARTIVGAETPFVFDAEPSDTSHVTVTYQLDTQLPRGPQQLEVSATVRLRNVPRAP